MIDKINKPEGRIGRNRQFKLYELKEAMENKTVLEGYVIKVDQNNNAYLEILQNHKHPKKIKAYITHKEFEFNSDGKELRIDILHRYVGKCVCFIVKNIIETESTIEIECSRREAQKEYYNYLVNVVRPGTVITAAVKRAESYGLFCDIGRGVIALLPSERICISKVNDARDLIDLNEVQVVFVGADERGKLVVSMRELLGTWEEEVSNFEPGEVVAGIVRVISGMDAVVEISPNLTGLADLPYKFDVEIGDTVQVYIKAIDRERTKLKLHIINVAKLDNSDKISYIHRLRGKIKQNIEYIGYWRYTPIKSTKVIESIFDENSVEKEKRRLFREANEKQLDEQIA